MSGENTGFSISAAYLLSVRPDTWVVLAASAFMVGVILLGGGMVARQGVAEWRSIHDTPDLIPVQAQLLHRYRDVRDSRGPLELWRYDVDGRTWYHFVSERRLLADPDPPPLLVDPARPWRPIPADRAPRGDWRAARWAGGAMLGLFLFCLVMYRVTLRRRRMPPSAAAGQPLPARVVDVYRPADECDRFVIDVVSLDGAIRVSSPPLWFDPRPFLPDRAQIIRVDGAAAGYQVDLGFLPEVRFA